MPEATSTQQPHPSLNGHSNGEAEGPPSTPFELLKAVKEVQERRIAVWREYDDAFDTFLDTSQSHSSSSGPVNGSRNNTTPPTEVHPESETGRGCAGCSTSTIPLSEDLLAQILQITTQALIECGHRLRTVQTELAHSTTPELASLVDRIQARENALLRSVVARDQLRKSTLKPVQTQSEVEAGGTETDEEQAKEKIQELDAQVKETRGEIAELMQEVYAESVELQLAEG